MAAQPNLEALDLGNHVPTSEPTPTSIATPVTPMDQDSLLQNLRRRSRGGCVSCKLAKVRCDEGRPTCGTCVRRGHKCRGYVNATANLRWRHSGPSVNKSERGKRAAETSPPNSPRKQSKPVSENRGSPPTTKDETVCSNTSSSTPSDQLDDRPRTESSSSERRPATSTQGTKSNALVRRKSVELLSSCPGPRDWPMGFFPSDLITPADEAAVTLYFTHHPVELVMGGEFTHEMNAKTIMVLQEDPPAVIDTLAAIGQLYVEGKRNSVVPALEKRAKTLMRLRMMKDPINHLEQMVVMILGLCGMELIDTKVRPFDALLPALIMNAAALIHQYIGAGLQISSVAKYFIRALARQDMVLSLTTLRRASIPTYVWLDDECRQAPDRYMGYTVTLMPLLEELTWLAEDLRDGILQKGLLTDGETLDLVPGSSIGITTPSYDTTTLKTRLESWRPAEMKNTPIRSSRRFLLQAYAVRSAALLYLHRLLFPHGSSPDADATGLNLAFEILANLSMPPMDLKLSLWPAFLAACELREDDDRLASIEIFDAIFLNRKTGTALFTKSFCLNRVWKARDSGLDWCWMRLVDKYPGECQPI